MGESIKEQGKLKYVHVVQIFIGDFCIVSLCVLTVLQVVLRYVFKAPLLGIEELMSFPIIWFYMIGGANASAESGHIECGLLESGKQSQKTKMILKFVKQLFSVAISLVLTYWCYSLFSYSLKVWKLSAILEIPMFFAESAPFIGLLLMSIFGVRDLIKSGADLRGISAGLSGEGR